MRRLRFASTKVKVKLLCILAAIIFCCVWQPWYRVPLLARVACHWHEALGGFDEERGDYGGAAWHFERAVRATECFEKERGELQRVIRNCANAYNQQCKYYMDVEQHPGAIRSVFDIIPTMLFPPSEKQLRARAKKARAIRVQAFRKAEAWYLREYEVSDDFPPYLIDVYLEYGLVNKAEQTALAHLASVQRKYGRQHPNAIYALEVLAGVQWGWLRDYAKFEKTMLKRNDFIRIYHGPYNEDITIAYIHLASKP